MSAEAERALVSTALRSVEAFDTAAMTLKPSDFSDDRMRLLWELIGKLRDMGHAVDELTIAAKLGKSERWALTGNDDPAEFLALLASKTPPKAALAEWVEIVKAASVASLIFGYCTELADVARDTRLTAEQKITEMHARLPIGDDITGDQFVSYADAAKDAVKQIIARTTGEITGTNTGMDHLDAMTGGLEPASLVILAGRPSHGKSIYMMDFAHAASATGPVFVFSLEMSRANVAMRGLSSLGRTDFGSLRSGRIDEHMEAQIRSAHAQMKTMPIFIDDRGGISVDQLRCRARSMARQHKPSLIIADYLTLMAGVGNNRTEQVGYVSRSLKAMAKELECPVLCLAQLNRGVDSRTDKRPTLSDLRDSGEIEQDADIVMFTYLHEKYDPETPRKGIGELIIAKQRNGETGSLFTEFQGRYQRFIEFTGEVPPENAETDSLSSGADYSKLRGKRNRDTAEAF